MWYGGINFDRPNEDDGEDTPENGGPEGHIYFGTLETWCPANGADRVISFGPRGGVRAESDLTHLRRPAMRI